MMCTVDSKRVLDIVVSVPMFVVSLPVQGVVAALVARKLGRPVLFRQQRPGLRGRPFTMYKFRTMLPEDAARGYADDASRMTDFGRLLRSTSLDELPSLWNVVRGDMSLVGPRPLLMEYLDRYSPVEARRHDVRPGITGLAQVNGRNAISWDERMRLDVAYVERRTLLLDLKIFARSIRAVLTREGITEVGHVTVSEFKGTRHDS